jgi:hypothetical protein
MKLKPESLAVETFDTTPDPTVNGGPDTYECDTFATTGGPWFCAAAC